MIERKQDNYLNLHIFISSITFFLPNTFKVSTILALNPSGDMSISLSLLAPLIRDSNSNALIALLVCPLALANVY